MYSSYSLTIERFRLVSPFPASPAAYLLSELAQDAFLQPLLCINLSSKSIQVLCQSSNLQSGRGRRAANTKTNQHCVNHSDVSEVAHNSTSCSASANSAAVAGSISRHTRSSCLATACDTRCWNWANCSAQREARLSVMRNRHDPASLCLEYLRGCLFIDTTKQSSSLAARCRLLGCRHRTREVS